MPALVRSRCPAPGAAPQRRHSHQIHRIVHEARRSRGLSRTQGPNRPCVALSAVPPVSTLATAGHLPAQIVGWVVIAGSCVRSVPQIIRITKNKSVQGISLLSFTSELGAFLITIAYNVHFSYPLSTWGETLTNAVQHAILVGMIFFYDKEVSTPAKALIVVGLTAGAAFLFSPICTEELLRWLQSLVIIILAVLGRLPQVVLNMRRGNSGELSFGSTLLSVIGNACRVYTTLALVRDPIIMATALSQLCLNSILLYQIVATIGQNRDSTGKLVIL
jgi:mannose-P-dolichol utilization defect protein 1